MGKCLGTLFIFVALMGCGGVGDPRGADDRRAFTSADLWYTPPSDFAGFTPLDKERFAAVVANLQPEAQAALAEVSAQRLNAEEAARLVGRPLPADGECILLRAVVLYDGTGELNVGLRGSAVHVHHGCLGRSPASMGRMAMVVVLPAIPESVFVSCSMAE